MQRPRPAIAVPALLSAGATLVLLAVFAASAAAGPDRSATNIHLSSKAPAFHGVVKSRAPVCVVNRKVQIYRKDSAGDVLLGSGRSDSHGDWVIHHPNFPSGEYYAKALRKTNQHQSRWAYICLSDVSTSVVVD